MPNIIKMLFLQLARLDLLQYGYSRISCLVSKYMYLYVRPISHIASCVRLHNKNFYSSSDWMRTRIINLVRWLWDRSQLVNAAKELLVMVAKLQTINWRAIAVRAELVVRPS